MEEDYCDRMALIGKALSDPTRVNILIMTGGRPFTISALLENMDTYQSNISYHVSVLWKAGLLERVDEGRWHNYKVSEKAMADIAEFLRVCGGD
ncbi:MAG: metalloregulator ArsR/SmtB family transcription factor [Thermoplasmata archaeon]|nr:metalloregulator ArsR/SmtB family transcription factor [Thermoplasmata archaeon]